MGRPIQRQRALLCSGGTGWAGLGRPAGAAPRVANGRSTALAAVLERPAGARATSRPGGAGAASRSGGAGAASAGGAALLQSADKKEGRTHVEGQKGKRVIFLCPSYLNCGGQKGVKDETDLKNKSSGTKLTFSKVQERTQV
jgi:hypothetical protein